MKKSIIEEYFDYYKFYYDKYGKNIIVFMQIGSFFEMYGIDNENEKLGNVKEISELLNIQMTRRNKAIQENSIKNPIMAGIPIVSFKRYLEILSKMNKYTVVIVEQVTEPPNPKREVTEIISPGTYIDFYGKDANNIISLYIQEEYNKNFIIGGTILDVTTGKNSVFEYFSKKDDKFFPFIEVERILKNNFPKEIIITTSNLSSFTEEDIIDKLNISNKLYYFFNSNNDKETKKLSYQENLLGTIFKNDSMLSNIEYLNFEMKEALLNSYIYLIKFVYEHNPLIINKIEKPFFIKENNYLKLANNAAAQLNIVNYNNSSSLFEIIDNTSTAVGRRYLKYRLLNPILDIEELNTNYNDIEIMKKHYLNIENKLDNIFDIEKLHRKLLLEKLNPSEFVLLHNSYESIINILEYSKKNINIDRKKTNLFLKNIYLEELLKFKEEYENIFNIDEMYKHNLIDINDNFFKTGINKEIDKLYNKNISFKKDLENIFIELNNGLNEDFFKLMNTEKEGYYINVTNNKFKEYCKNNKIDDESIFINFLNLKFKDLKIKTLKNNKKITFDYLNKISENLLLNNIKLNKLIKEEYLKTIKTFGEKYFLLFDELTKYLSYVDFIKSNSKSAIKFNYVRPNIVKNDTSFVNIKNLRHPIVEKLNNDIDYVGNDINIGNCEKDGIILFGVNASGKSTLMKSLGIAIVMAQSGMFVSADKMDFYPFHKIFTRISGDDDIFKGLSTFAVEMSELRNILKYSDENTIVLGDEISHGTETISGISIVSSAIINLSNKNTKFLFSTHLHEISKLEDIQNLKNTKLYHLSVIFDDKNDILIYDRKLKEGSGKPIYGLEVAKAMDLDNDFLKLAHKIRNKITDEKDLTKQDLLLSGQYKESNYNSSVIMDKCVFCNNNAVHTHHILEQYKFKDDKEGIHFSYKNKNFNLLPLCEKHHNMIHEIIKTKWKNNDEPYMYFSQTSKGKKLILNPKFEKYFIK